MARANRELKEAAKDRILVRLNNNFISEIVQAEDAEDQMRIFKKGLDKFTYKELGALNFILAGIGLASDNKEKIKNDETRERE